MAFGSASGGLSQSSSLYWDNANSRLGIGTNSPTGDIHIIKNNVANAAINIWGAPKDNTTIDNTSGVGIYLNHNTSGNRQLIIADSSSLQGVRLRSNKIDAIDMNNQTGMDLYLGTIYNGVHVG